MTLKKQTLKERKAIYSTTELLELAGCLEEIDPDVYELCLRAMPKDGHLISLVDFMKEVQKMKNKLIKSLSKKGWVKT